MKKAKIRALGIDLGTTNSAAAEIVWDPESGARPEIRVLEIEQPTREGVYSSPLVPSVVAVLDNNQIWVGEGAKRLRAFPVEYGLSFERNLFYDTKNEMGLRKTYYRAPEAFNHASKIGGQVLKFIAGEAAKQGACGGSADGPDGPMAVTVPASFQMNQRRDTLQAARLAGLSLSDDDLLDEPTAALIDVLAGDASGSFISDGHRALCVVFDFGGGTCDVSVVEVSRTAGAKSESANDLLPAGLAGLTMSHLAVSRYHRLGGGDIDAAIVHEVIIPRLLAENGLKPLDLSFAQKKKGLEPQLLGKAEALKIALSSEISRLIKFGRYTPAVDKSTVVVRQPAITCVLGSSVYTLSSPSLSAADFERILVPFLDTHFLFARVTEYLLTQSIFAPLRDAMDRAGRDASGVGLCLMAGGSSQIPQVRDAVREFFPKARHVFFDDGLEAKLCVARGAAWNAAYKALVDEPLIRPVLHDGIVLITQDGKPNPLLASGTELPFPPDESYLAERLQVPRAAGAQVRELRFEIVGERDRQHIFDEIWKLPEAVAPGDAIILEYRLTRGKQFNCRARLAERPSSYLEMTTENPLVNVANPNAIQLQIEELEEGLRQRQGGAARDRETYIELARKYAELNQREKALDYLRTAQSRISRPDPTILNLQGIFFGELGDHAREERAYLEADKAAPLWGGPLFNLALSLRSRGKHSEALKIIEQAIQRAKNLGPYLALKALILDSLGWPDESKSVAAESVGAFDPLVVLDDWSLGWLVTASSTANDPETLRRAEDEQRKRRRDENATEWRDSVPRPAMMGDIALLGGAKDGNGRKKGHS